MSLPRHAYISSLPSVPYITSFRSVPSQVPSRLLLDSVGQCIVLAAYATPAWVVVISIARATATTARLILVAISLPPLLGVSTSRGDHLIPPRGLRVPPLTRFYGLACGSVQALAPASASAATPTV